MIDISDPLVKLKVTMTTCGLVAICCTVYRLYIRRARLWADDAWAAFALSQILIQVVAVFMHIPVPNSFTQNQRVSAYYLMAITFYTVIWSSRLSILFSIIRIDPWENRRRILYVITVFFILALLVLFAQLFWVCEKEPAWKTAANPQCNLSRQVVVVQLTTDVVSDLFLLLAPLSLLRQLQDKALRRKLMLIFSTCLVTTIVSLVHAVYILKDGGYKVVIAALVEDSMSLIVASLPVTVTSLIRLKEDDQVSTFDTTAATKLSFAPWIRTRRTGFSTVVSIPPHQTNISDATSSDSRAVELDFLKTKEHV